MTHVDTPFESPAILSVCTGIRGLERGLERCIGPVRTIAYVENEAIVIENLVQQMEQGVLAPAPVWADIKNFPSEYFFRKIQGIIGGYPCTPFSRIGKMAGGDDPRHLYPFIPRIIRKTGFPDFLWFENVVEHSRKGFDEVYSDLHHMGYAVEAGIFSAVEVGLEHQRERFFILAIRKTLGYSYIKRLEGFTRNVKNKGEGEKSSRSTSPSSFPLAFQGQPQFIYEERRVISRMDYTINGYNFIEDILRMAGNSVVEQTAELAFRTLIQKF